MRLLRSLLKLLRPHQWVKSGFVFVGLVFGHGWSDPVLVQKVVLAAMSTTNRSVTSVGMPLAAPWPTSS